MEKTKASIEKRLGPRLANKEWKVPLPKNSRKPTLHELTTLDGEVP